MSVLIKRNTPIPCRKTRTYTTVEDFQTSVDVVIFEGERPVRWDARELFPCREREKGSMKRDGEASNPDSIGALGKGLWNIQVRQLYGGKRKGVVRSFYEAENF